MLVTKTEDDKYWYVLGFADLISIVIGYLEFPYNYVINQRILQIVYTSLFKHGVDIVSVIGYNLVLHTSTQK